MIHVKLILTALACIAAVLSIVPTLIAGIVKGISIWRMKDE